MLLYLPQAFFFIWQTKMSLLVAIAPNPILCSPLFPNRCATSFRDYWVTPYFEHTITSASRWVRHSSHTSSEPPSEGRAFFAAITGERGTSKCSWWKRVGEKDRVQDSISEGKIRFCRFRIKVVPDSYFYLFPASATNSVHDLSSCW